MRYGSASKNTLMNFYFQIKENYIVKKQKFSYFEINLLNIISLTFKVFDNRISHKLYNIFCASPTNLCALVIDLIFHI